MKKNGNCSFIERRFFLMSCLIHQLLALCTLHCDSSPLSVGNTEFRASAAAEIEFSQIPIQMLLIHVLVDAYQTALEHAKEALKGIVCTSPRAHSYLEWSTDSCLRT
jgi:hypothetical protein